MTIQQRNSIVATQNRLAGCHESLRNLRKELVSLQVDIRSGEIGATDINGRLDEMIKLVRRALR